MTTHPGKFAVTSQTGTGLPVVKDIFGVSAEFLGELKTWLEQNPPSIPITQIIGFTGFTVKASTRINASESTTSTTYTSLTTPGPSLTGLPNGQYLVLYGAAGCSTSGSGHECFMNVSENSAAPGSDDRALQFSDTVFGVGGATGYATTLSNAGNNSLTAVYRTSNAAASAFFNHRWIIAIKFADA